MGKMQGFWFSMYGLPDEEVGKETGPKGTVYGLLCMGLQCLVYGKNAGVLVFYVWVAWRRCWEGNGAEGCLRLKERMVILCCDSNNGDSLL
jgi:hypothetical protein